MDNKEYFDKYYRPEKRHRWKSTLGQDGFFCLFFIFICYVIIKGGDI